MDLFEAYSHSGMSSFQCSVDISAIEPPTLGKSPHRDSHQEINTHLFRPAMLIGKTVAISAALAYLFVEVFQSFHVILFIAFEFLLGSSSGICSVYRTHIAMASTEADRSRAFGITQLATASGFVVGPRKFICTLTVIKMGE